MDHARNNATRRAAFVAASVVLVAAAVCIAMAMADTACAAQAEKHPIPRVTKEASCDGKAYAERVDAEAGGTVRYLVRATVPENAAELDCLVYELYDVPDDCLRIDCTGMAARVVDTSGVEVAKLAPQASRGEGGRVAVELGDVKKACLDLSYGQEVIVEYAATVSPGATRGEYLNRVKLMYDDGSGRKETVEAMAVADVKPASAGNVAAARTGKRDGDRRLGALPTTGDGISAVIAVAVLVVAFASMGIELSWKKSRIVENAGRKDRNGQLLQTND